MSQDLRTNQTARKYRSDIQGLRAIAVTIVMLYHAGWPLSGGFLGVDIFFVVSGFVISQVLITELESSGRLKFRNFFYRRFLRLAPALSVVSIVTVVSVYFLLTPSSSQADTAKTAIAATLGIANAVIAQVSGGYFGNAPESNALLHTWTLSVEEQFYVVFTFALAGVWAILRKRNIQNLRRLQRVVWLVFFVSFGFALVPGIFALDWGQFLFGFYSPLTRAWEFSIGVLSYLLTRQYLVTKRVATSLNFAGVTMLLLGVLLISESSQTPGISTLFPTVGTGLILVAGSRREGRLFGLLSKKWIVKFGDFSYSLYLWHWPVIFVVGQIWPDSFVALQFAVLGSIALALWSYRFIERPFRTRTSSLDRTAVVIGLAIIMTPITVGALLLQFQDKTWAWLDSTGLMRVAHQGEIGTTNSLNLLESRSVECERPGQSLSGDVSAGRDVRCWQSLADGEPSVAVVGDSHGIALFAGLSEQWEDEVVSFFMVDWSGRDELRTREKNDQELELVMSLLEEDADMIHVVFTGFWAQRQYPLWKLDDFVAGLVDSGKQVYFSDDVPDFEFGPERCKYGSSWISNQSPVCAQWKESSTIEKQENLRALVSWVESNENITLLETRDFFCDEKSCSMISDQGLLLYGDDDHLNINGARHMGERIVLNYPQLLER